MVLNNVTPENAVERLLEEAKRTHYEQIEKLKKVADDAWKPANKLLLAPKAAKYTWGSHEHCLDYPSYWFKSKGFYGSDWAYLKSKQEIENNKITILKCIDEYVKDCQDVYDSNVPLIVENKNIIERIGLIMRTIGVPDSYTHSYYKTNNSRNKTTENKIAGWREDAARNIPTTNINIPDKKRLVQSVEEAYAKAIHAAGEAEREVKKKEEELLKQNELAMLRVKYTPDNALSDAWDILFKILKEDKYLCLAHYLQLNRGDWSDGYHYAETGIDGFSADSPEDKLIYKEITGLIENWDGDGRVFRDCKYNYDYLFNLVEDHLVKDYNIVCKYINFC